jgi:fibronectin type 3 domain-containing protein
MRKLRWLLFAFALLYAVHPTIAQGGHSLTLGWTSAPDPSCVAPSCTLSYNVYRGTSAGGESATPLNASPITTTTYTDSTVALGNTYFYVVKEVATGSIVALSPASNEVSVTFPGAPGAPTGLQITNVQ